MKADGYAYKKGFSRSVSSSSNTSSEDEPPVKRAKLSTDERHAEIETISELITTTEDSIKTRRLQLNKAKTVNNFSQCAEISDKIRKLLTEKNDYRKQLVALQKREAKSAWYLHRKPKKVSSDCPKPKMKSDNNSNSGDIRKVFQTERELSQAEQSGKERDELKSDSSSQDTLILDSSSSDGNQDF